jgi:hypothetical protein
MQLAAENAPLRKQLLPFLGYGNPAAALLLLLLLPQCSCSCSHRGSAAAAAAAPWPLPRSCPLPPLAELRRVPHSVVLLPGHITTTTTTMVMRHQQSPLMD